MSIEGKPTSNFGGNDMPSLSTDKQDNAKFSEKDVYLVTNADLRESSNRKCWPIAAEFELKLQNIVTSRFGRQLVRANVFKQDEGHGFISSQKEGNEVFAKIPPMAPVIVLITTWQYSHHIAAGISSHKGPVLLLANFDGTWPGLVGMLNLAGSLTSLERPYSRLWSERFDDQAFFAGLESWLSTGRISHDLSHLHRIPASHPVIHSDDGAIGVRIAETSLKNKEILGIFDMGCMGMLNGIFPMKALIDIGMPVENLSQSDLLVEMQAVPQALREECLAWYQARGMKFNFGTSEESDLTHAQVLEQCAMLIALVRYTERFGLTAVGVQYQQGLARCCAASDFAEGAIGSTSRFPIHPEGKTGAIRPNEPIPSINEVDIGSAIPQVLFLRLLQSYGLPAETTLHDVRWGSDFEGTFYWDFEISGAVPFEHLKGGISGAEGYRQAPMYFPKGGSTIAGQGKEGDVIWARAHYVGTEVHLHLGTGKGVELPKDEFARRRKATSPEWPLLNVALDGISRDQFMAGHQSNHVTIAYVDAQKKREVFRAAVAQALTHGMVVTVAGAAIDYL